MYEKRAGTLRLITALKRRAEDPALSECLRYDRYQLMDDIQALKDYVTDATDIIQTLNELSETMTANQLQVFAERAESSLSDGGSYADY